MDYFSCKGVKEQGAKFFSFRMRIFFLAARREKIA
jgi:hypothetical protein